VGDEAPKTPSGGEGVSPSSMGWVGSGEGNVPPLKNFFSIFDLKYANFGANWVLFAHYAKM